MSAKPHPFARVRTGTGLAVFGVAAGVLGLGTHALTGRLNDIVHNFVLHTATSAIVLGLIAMAAVRRQPSNRAVWALLIVVAAQGLEIVGWAYTALFAPETGPGSFEAIVFGDGAPVDLRLDVAVAQWLANWIWVPGLAGWLTFGLMWFPDGELTSRRWRWLPVVSGFGIGLVSLSAAIAYWPTSDIPFALLEEGLEGSLTSVFMAGAVFIGVGVVGTLASLVAGFRSASPDVRDGLKWMLLGSSGPAALILVLIPIGAEATAWGGLFLVPFVLVCYGIAILRYRAFDIDLIISRTLVYGSLAAFITVVYVAIVVGVDLVVAGGDGSPNPAISLVAITIVAITVQPLRRWLTQQANRVVFGRKSTPYEVLSDFSRRVSATDEHLLERVARSLVEGTPAVAASVWVEDSGQLHPAAAWPAEEAPSTSVSADGDLHDLPAASEVFPVRHGGDLMGAIGMSVPPGAALSPTDVRLLEQVAGGMGLALRNLRLTESLRHRVEELQESRRRIVKVRDETRRRLERDLHDGAQQRLVALRVRLGLVGRMVEKDGAEELRTAVTTIAEEAQGAIDTLRDFARGVYPPLLEAEGLGPALTAQARRSPVPVEVEAHDVGRHGRDVEAAVYFAALEGLQNVVKHADATLARVEISVDGGALRFRVSDDGRGIDDAVEGLGLRNIRDRLDALGGRVSIASSPSGGTIVEGDVPVADTTEVSA